MITKEKWNVKCVSIIWQFTQSDKGEYLNLSYKINTKTVTLICLQIMYIQFTKFNILAQNDKFNNTFNWCLLIHLIILVSVCNGGLSCNNLVVLEFWMVLLKEWVVESSRKPFCITIPSLCGKDSKCQLKVASGQATTRNELGYDVIVSFLQMSQTIQHAHNLVVSGHKTVCRITDKSFYGMKLVSV
jgi:hypothetical protein